VCIAVPHRRPLAPCPLAFPRAHHTRALHQELNEEKAERAAVRACMPSLDTYAELKARGMARPPDVAEGPYPEAWDFLTVFPLDKDGNFVCDGVFARAILMDAKNGKSSLDTRWFFDNTIRDAATRTSTAACTALFVRGAPHVAFVDRSSGYAAGFYSKNAGRVISPTIKKIREARPLDQPYEIMGLVAQRYTATLPVSATLALVMPHGRTMNTAGVLDPVTFMAANECVRVAIPERALDAYDSD
jgi:hypothetical protein